MLAVLTIAGGLFVLGFFLVLNANLQRLVGRWTESAELSVYLKDDVTARSAQDRRRADRRQRPGGAPRVRLEGSRPPRDSARTFPISPAPPMRLEANPFPASFEVRLKPEVRDAGAAVDNLATTLGGIAGVADVRYDRRWLTRLNAVVRFLRALGLIIIVLLAVASALTVANVVRLAASARQDEIEIMQLVGAPLAYVRGPFVVEGILQGGAGALLAMLLLWALFAAARARYGQMAAETIGLGSITFLPFHLGLAIVVGGHAARLHRRADRRPRASAEPRRSLACVIPSPLTAARSAFTLVLSVTNDPREESHGTRRQPGSGLERPCQSSFRLLSGGIHQASRMPRSGSVSTSRRARSPMPTTRWPACSAISSSYARRTMPTS